jgi:pyruvate-formate lyase-activating enzyme
MSLLDDDQFSEHYRLFCKYGWPHLSAMLDTLAPSSANMDHLTRTVLFNGLGKYFHLTAKLALIPGTSMAEAHAQAVAEVMEDPAVSHLVQTQLKQMLDQGVAKFQEENQ